MTIAKRSMIDTNVLVYAYCRKSLHRVASRRLLKRAYEGTELFCVSPQVFVEFFATITKPKRVPEPLPPTEALGEIAKIKAFSGIMTLPVPLDVVERWSELVRQHAVTGQKIYDVQLVATMLGYEVSHIYTYNHKDFAPYPVTPIAPPADRVG